jgi:hypothetical protein
MSRPVETPDAREIDARVAREIMGLRVLEERLTIVGVDGELSVHPDSDPEGWMCYAALGPVYVEDYGHEWPRPEMEESYVGYEAVLHREQERWNADMARFGVPSHCLQAVPFYSTDIAAAFEVVEKMRALGYAVFVGGRPDAWEAEIVGPGGLDYAVDDQPSAPLAICLAALATLPESHGREPGRDADG